MVVKSLIYVSCPNMLHNCDINGCSLLINNTISAFIVYKFNVSKQIQGKMLVETAHKIATALDVPIWQLFASPSDVAGNKDGIFICPNCGARLEIKKVEQKEM